MAPLLTSGALVGAGDRAARRHAVEGDGEDEAEQLVSNTRHRHRLKLPTGVFVVGTWRHRVMAKPGVIVRSLGTGWCHQPVPIPPSAFGTSWWHHPVPIREF